MTAGRVREIREDLGDFMITVRGAGNPTPEQIDQAVHDVNELIDEVDKPHRATFCSGDKVTDIDRGRDGIVIDVDGNKIKIIWDEEPGAIYSYDKSKFTIHHVEWAWDI